MQQPRIIVTNDDGITAPGISVLIQLMDKIGQVIVVAPDSPQSGMGHAVTIGQPLRLSPTDIYGNIEAYQCSGTPADCIKMAKAEILKGKKPDLIVSGINHGGNTSISILYSGTMSAAIEGAIEGIPSIGYSLCDHAEEADFAHIKNYVVTIAKEVLQRQLPPGIALNVNFPTKRNEKIKGIKICRQAHAKWEERFNERFDPYGRRYFWMAGNYNVSDNGEAHDEWAIAHNYVSIVPCQFDLTAHNAIDTLNNTWNLSP